MYVYFKKYALMPPLSLLFSGYKKILLLLVIISYWLYIYINKLYYLKRKFQLIKYFELSIYCFIVLSLIFVLVIIIIIIIILLLLLLLL